MMQAPENTALLRLYFELPKTPLDTFLLWDWRESLVTCELSASDLPVDWIYKLSDQIT